jgi:hypothetical protein
MAPASDGNEIERKRALLLFLDMTLLLDRESRRSASIHMHNLPLTLFVVHQLLYFLYLDHSASLCLPRFLMYLHQEVNFGFSAMFGPSSSRQVHARGAFHFCERPEIGINQCSSETRDNAITHKATFLDTFPGGLDLAPFFSFSILCGCLFNAAASGGSRIG